MPWPRWSTVRPPNSTDLFDMLESKHCEESELDKEVEEMEKDFFLELNIPEEEEKIDKLDVTQEKGDEEEEKIELDLNIEIDQTQEKSGKATSLEQDKSGDEVSAAETGWKEDEQEDEIYTIDQDLRQFMKLILEDILIKTSTISESGMFPDKSSSGLMVGQFLAHVLLT